MNRRIVHFCAFTGCRELIGEHQHVCGAHWRDLPVLLQRSLTGSRGDEREAAKRAVDEWIKTRTLPTLEAPKPFNETKDSEA